jgi:hypothetical protein
VAEGEEEAAQLAARAAEGIVADLAKTSFKEAETVGADVTEDAAKTAAEDAGKDVAEDGGRLTVTAANPSASERRAAQFMADQGHDVELRDPVGTRAGGGTSDLLVDGERWDVYTPQTKNPNRIISAVASKGSQVLGGGVIIDLAESEVTADQLGNVAARIAGTGARVGKIVVMP